MNRCLRDNAYLNSSAFTAIYMQIYVFSLRFSLYMFFTCAGGFAQSELMSGHLIDFFVPFLPLEYRHVKLCAHDAYAARGLQPDEGTLDEVAKAMLYVPKEEKLFSAQGCKSIPQRINFFLP